MYCTVTQEIPKKGFQFFSHHEKKDETLSAHRSLEKIELLFYLYCNDNERINNNRHTEE
jgi:hypothetical protein